MKAWRERWTDSQFGTNMKTVLGRGVSGDQYGLADTLLQLALNGPAPNQLLFSLLNHSLATQLVSYPATLVALAKFSAFSRPHCTTALLKLVLQHRQYITSRGRGEDCVVLARSLVCLATWTLTTATQTILRLVELRDSKTDLSNLDLAVALLKWFTREKFPACLLHVGRQDDQELHQEFILAAKGMSKATEQMYILLEPEEDGAASPLSPLLTELVAALQDIKQLQPPLLALEEDGSFTSLTYTLHALLAFDVILQPTSDLSQLANQLVVIMNVRRVSLSTLVCEITRCCLLAMNEHDGIEVLRWDAFTFIKLHQLVEKILAETKLEAREVYQGLHNLLDYVSLLDLTDAKCKANTYDLVVKTFAGEGRGSAPILTDGEYQQLTAPGPSN